MLARMLFWFDGRSDKHITKTTDGVKLTLCFVFGVSWWRNF